MDASSQHPRCIAPKKKWCDHFCRILYSSTRHIEKVEGGERDTQLVHVNEANSCLARGYCVSQAAQGDLRLSSPPPPTHALPMVKLCDFQDLQPKVRKASIWRLNNVAAEFGQLL